MNIFLLRGLVREKRHWGNFVKHLKEAIPHAHIITPEIQGVGDFHKLESPNNLDDMIHFMREKNQSSFVKKHPKNMIVAMSLGGMIAKRWCELYPEDFSKMMLINTSFKGISPLHHRVKPLSILRFIKIFLTPSIHSREKAMIRMVSNDSKKHEPTSKEWIEIQQSAPVSRASFLNQIKAAIQFNPSKSKPNQSVVIVAAKNDKLCNYKSSLKIHEIWGGELKLHPTAGHDFSIDEPIWLIQEIIEFSKK